MIVVQCAYVFAPIRARARDPEAHRCSADSRRGAGCHHLLASAPLPAVAGAGAEGCTGTRCEAAACFDLLGLGLDQLDQVGVLWIRSADFRSPWTCECSMHVFVRHSPLRYHGEPTWELHRLRLASAGSGRSGSGTPRCPGTSLSWLVRRHPAPRGASRASTARRSRRGYSSSSLRPVAGAGISTSTLSGAPADRLVALDPVPGRFGHSIIVPSATEIPIWGIVTSRAARLRGEEPRQALHVVQPGSTDCSSGGLNGIGTSGAVSAAPARRGTRTPPRRSARHLGPTPQERVASCATRTLPVLLDAGQDRLGVERTEVRRSITSMSSSSSSAACSAR